MENNSKYMLDGIQFMGDNVRSKLKFCGQNVRLYPLSKVIRAENAELDNNCQIFDHVFIDAGKGLKIGKYSTLAWYVLIEGGANTYIGDRVFLGPSTKLLTSTLQINEFFTVEHLPDGCHKIESGDIIIEDDAYLGANCTVLPGVKIGEGAVVGANSLVVRDLEPWTIYVGSPCKPIKMRIKPTEERKKKLMEVNWDKR